MTRLRSNFFVGQITDNPLASGATAINSASFNELPVIASPDYMVLTLDPKGVFGLPEIVYVTAHASAATVVTVTRGQEGTAARSHQQNEVWVNAPTAQDFSATATPSTSNVGDAAAIGTSDAEAKADHLHAREGWATSAPAAIMIGPGGTGADTHSARHDHGHPVTLGGPSSSAPGDAGYAGATGDSLASAMHQHVREGFGIPLSSVPGDSPIQGSGPTVAASNHVHGREGVGVAGSSAPGDAAAQGAGPTIAFSNHVHAREPIVAPTDSNIGDTQVTGTTASVASGGHRHARVLPVHISDTTDGASDWTWGGTSNAFATLGNPSGRPKVGPITPPPSGIVRFYVAFTGGQQAQSVVDFYLAVGWSTSGSRAGMWAGSVIQTPGGGDGTTGANATYVTVYAGMMDGTPNSFNNVKAITAMWSYYGFTQTPLYFYLLWGASSAMICPANSRVAAREGTLLRVETVP